MTNPHDQQPPQQGPPPSPFGYQQPPANGSHQQQPQYQPGPTPQQQPYSPGPPPPSPFAGAAQPQQHAPQRPKIGASLRPAQWIGIAGIIALIIGMLIGDIAGFVVIIIGAIAVIIGIADAVKKLLDERKQP